MTELETKIKEYYKELYNDFKKSKKKDWFEKSACHFTAMKGKYYDRQEIKLLVVGIATNSWEPLDIQNEETFSSAAVNKMTQQVIDEQVMKGCMKNSPFWNYSRDIFEGLTSKTVDTENDMVANYIAWNNLYKIAPNHPKKHGNNNPTGKQQQIQRETAKKILQTEIDFLAPTYILFITERNTKKEEEKTWWSWIEPFIKGETAEDRKKMNGFLEIKNTGEDIVKGKGLYSDECVKNIKVVIAVRPESVEKAKWVAAVMAAFKSL